MKMKFVNKIVVFVIMLLLLCNTMSYASSLTVGELNQSLTEMFSNDIEVRIEKDSQTSVKKFNSKDVKIDNSKITLTDKNNKQYVVNSTLENNTSKFTIDFSTKLDENVATKEEIMEEAKGLEEYSILQVCYLAVADVLEKDLSLAYLYWADNEGKDTTEVFDLNTEIVNSSGKLELVLNLDEFANLDNTKITTAMKCQITLTSKKVEVESGGNSTENTDNTNQSSTNTTNKENTIKNDNVANIEKIPEAGTEFGVENVLEIIISVAIVGIVILVIKHVYSLKKEE